MMGGFQASADEGSFLQHGVPLLLEHQHVAPWARIASSRRSEAATST
jgi:hypothetical protein